MKKFLYCTALILITISTSFSQELAQPIETFSLESSVLHQTRTINVWHPALEQDTSQKLQVIYMADGGVQEDFIHVATTLQQLFEQKLIPAVMLVGIENIARRYDLTSESNNPEDKLIAPKIGGAPIFRTFIEKELIPLIQQKYPQGDKRGLLGESLNGLFVLETFIENPTLFDFYISFDASVWWNDYALTNRNLNKLAVQYPKATLLWFASSNTPGIKEDTQKLAQELTNRAPKNLLWEHTYFDQENHGTLFKATKEKAFMWILNQP